MKTTVTLFMLCCALFVSAQPLLPKKVLARLPAELDSHKMPTSTQLQKDLCHDSGWGQNGRTVQKLWVAYSDREDNITYTSPAERIPFGYLRFGEKVSIAEIKGDMAHVYSDEKAHYPEIMNGIKSKGWVPMDKLLLWNKCPLDKSGVQRRVLRVVNLDKMPRDGKVHLMKYNSPDDLVMATAMKMDFGLFFLMKEADHGEYALLSSSAQVKSAQSLFGWVNKNNFVDFSQRIFLEPEWTPSFVEAHRGEKAFIYGDEDMISVIMHLEYGANNGDSNPLYKYRMNKNQLRLPILSKPDVNGMIRCMCFGIATNYYESFLKERTGIYYNEVMEQIKDVVCSYEGYIKLGAGWRYVLLLSSDELDEILDMFEPIANATLTCSSDRKAFARVLLSTVKERSDNGIKLGDSDIVKMPIWKLLYLIYGIDKVEENHDDLYRFSLQEMKNRKIVSDDDYRAILSRLEKKYKRLSSFISNYEYRIDIQGMYYYWIPLDDMP